MDSLTIRDVLQARATIRPYLRPTPMYTYPALNQALGMQLYIKHENHSPIGSFKARGALNALSQHVADRRAVACSTGNHGQGVAFAARLLGMEATIVVPEWANREKTAAIEAQGGRVVFHGQVMPESQAKAEELVREQGAYFAQDGEDLLIHAGAGTIALEIVDDLPDVDVVVIPLGDGALAGGCCTVLRAMAPNARSLGVQSSACPAMFHSWQRGRAVQEAGKTMADGLAVVDPNAKAVRILREVLDDAVLVSEDQLEEGIRTLLRYTHNLAEGAGSAAVAACFQERERLAGKKVVALLTGGNLDTKLLPRILEGAASA